MKQETKDRVVQGPANTTEAPPARRSNHHGNFFGIYGVPIFLAVMLIVFSVLMPRTFATGSNFISILADQAIPGILALAAILPLAAGEFDLSLGAVLGFTAITTIALSNAGLPLPMVVVLALAIGGVIGAVNAVLVIGVGVNAFIATLGIGTVLAGLNLLITGGSLLNLDSDVFAALTRTKVLGVQVVFVYFLVVAALLWFAFEKAPFGRYLRATGMGREAARLSGVRTNRYLATAFIAGGVLAALAGVLVASRSGSAPPTLGPEFLLPAYAAAFLGATTLRPGYFNVWGTVIGVFILAVGSNGLVILGAQTWVTNVFNGTALIVAVSASVLVRRRKVKTRSVRSSGKNPQDARKSGPAGTRS